MASIALPPVVDLATAAHLAGGIAAALAGPDDIVLDGSDVERIGIPGLQVLASAVRTADATGRRLTIAMPSDALVAAVRVSGLGTALHVDR